MSVAKSLILGLGGAAVMVTGLAGTANAHVVAAGAGSCENYAREYAAVNAPQFGFFGWNAAYRHAYNECLSGGPSFVSVSPAGVDYRYNQGPFAGFGSMLAAPVVAGANIAGAAVNAGATVAGAAVNAGASIAGAALSIPGAILGGTAAAISAPFQPVVEPAAAPAPVVSKNYRGTYETVAMAEPLASTSALAVPAASTSTPDWHAYCAAKYRSYNPDTGMYLAYSGTYRMCS